MRHTRLLLYVTALAAGLLALPTAQAAPYNPQFPTYSTTQNLTGTAPSTSTDGTGLGSVNAIRLSLCAANAQTLSGTGTLRAWVYLNASGLWARDPTLDMSVSVSGQRCQAWPDVAVGVRIGRVAYITDSVTVSGGTTVTVLLEETMR